MQLQINGAPRELVLPTPTLAEVLAALDLAGKRVAVELNGTIVPRSRHAGTRIHAGDRLEIVAAVGGG